MIKFYRSILFGLSMFICIGLQAQQTITGTITDGEGEPLIGVNILIKGTSTGTITDYDGNYTLEANQGDVLVFSYTGFAPQEFEVGTEENISFIMQEGTNLDEVVVVGYGSQKKVTVTGAVAQLKGDELVQSPAVDISNSLSGRLPGLVVIQPSAEPGADGANITIRGSNTLGNNSPLVVIDGVPDREGGLGRLSPLDIASVSVLKDASAAIYGARAANGAIIVTTKRGEIGKPKLSYSFNQGWAQPTRVPEMSSAVEYANIMNELPIYKSIPVEEWGAAWDAIQTTGFYDSPTDGVGDISANFSPEAVRLHGEGSDPWGFPDEDWFDAAFQNWAPQSRHQLGISGGTDELRYFASLGYLSQEAFYENSATKYQQYSIRANLDAKVSKYVNANLGIHARREDRNYPTESSDAIFRMLMRGRPTEPAIWPTGEPGPDIENGQNPVVITTNATGFQDNPRDLIQLNGGVDITNPWVEGLTLKLSAAVDNTNEQLRIWQTPWELYFWDRTTFGSDGNPQLEAAVRSNFKNAQLTQSSNSVLNTNLTGILTYDRELGGGHFINLLAGVTREKFTGSNFLAFRRNYISAAVDQLFAGGSVGQNTDGGAYDRARLGYYGRVQYNFKEKYLAEFIWRYDGSYIFPESDRFGFFPGILLGWNVAQEDWFDVPWLDHLKIRTSYGQMGNDQVFFNNQLQEFAFLSSYSFGQYPIDGVVESTLFETVLANPNFTWERANNFNFGLDGTIKGKLDFTFEYFYNRRDQILIQETGSTPATSGISSLLPPVNAGKVDNSGFEFWTQLNLGNNNDLRYSIGINGGYAKNEVVFMDEIPGAPDYQLQEGKPIGAYLVYENDGVFRDQAEIEANTIDYSAVTGQLIPGDLKFKDQNGDGIIDADDQIRLDKNLTPTLNFGATFNLNYKAFDLAVLFQGATGALVPLMTESGDIGNFLKYSHDNRWSIDNPSSEHPRLASRGDTYYTGGPYGNNDYFLFNKNYLRLKNLEVGYTLPDNLLNRFGIGSLRVYLNGSNLFTIDEHGVFDPETESTSGVFYPQSRVINTGLSVTF